MPRAQYDGTGAFPAASGSIQTARQRAVQVTVSWHNMHHSDPACARHGVDRGQIDLSAGLIRALERIG